MVKKWQSWDSNLASLAPGSELLHYTVGNAYSINERVNEWFVRNEKQIFKTRRLELLTVQFVASAVEWFWSIHIFTLFIILNGSEMSQSSHESTEVYLVLPVWET